MAARRECWLPAWAALGPHAHPRRHAHWPFRARPPGASGSTTTTHRGRAPGWDGSHAAAAAISRCSLLRAHSAAISLDSRTANRTLVGSRSPRSTSSTSRSWQRFGHCQAGSGVARVAARGSIEASVAWSSIRVPSCAAGGEVRAGWSACRLQQRIRAEGRPWRVSAGPRYRPGAIRTAWTIAGSCAARSPLSSDRSRGQWLGSKGVDASQDGGPR
jgi:hypothetical protein